MSIWQHLFSFEGRINRRTYWYAVIVDIICTVIFLTLLIIPVDTYFMFFKELGVLELYDAVNIFRPLTLLVGLPLSIWAGHAITVKRLHDRNRSGWWNACRTVVMWIAHWWGRVWKITSPLITKTWRDTIKKMVSQELGITEVSGQQDIC